MRCPMLWPKFDSMLAVPESWPRSAMRIQKKWPAFGVPVAGHFTGTHGVITVQARSEGLLPASTQIRVA